MAESVGTPTDNALNEHAELEEQLADPSVHADQARARELGRRYAELGPLVAAIREDKPYNEVNRGAEASLVTSMGRMAAHTGQVITFDEMLACKHEFAPTVDKLVIDGPAPLQVDPKTGHYPWPQPGIIRDREF